MLSFLFKNTSKYCQQQNTFAKITQHFIKKNQETLATLVRQKGPIFAIQVLKACIGSGEISNKVVKTSVQVLNKCQGEYFLQSFFTPIEKFLQEYDQNLYTKIRKSAIPEQKIIKLPGGGSLTISTWNSHNQIKQSYDKLITDLPYQFQVTDKGQIQWNEQEIKGKNIVQYLENCFNSDEFSLMGQKLYVVRPNMLTQEYPAFEKVIKYIKAAKRSPQLIVSGMPQICKIILREQKSFQQLLHNLSLIPYLKMLAPWHYRFQYNTDCCKQNQPLLRGIQQFEEKIMELTNENGVTFDVKATFNTIVSKTSVSQNTLVLLQDRNYSLIAPALGVFQWQKHKNNFKNYDIRADLAEFLNTKGAQIEEKMKSLDEKKQVEKNILNEVVYDLTYNMEDELFKDKPELLKFKNECKKEYESHKKLNNVIDNEQINEFWKNEYHLCPLTAFALRITCENLIEKVRSEEKGEVFDKIRNLLIK